MEIEREQGSFSSKSQYLTDPMVANLHQLANASSFYSKILLVLVVTGLKKLERQSHKCLSRDLGNGTSSSLAKQVQYILIYHAASLVVLE